MGSLTPGLSSLSGRGLGGLGGHGTLLGRTLPSWHTFLGICSFLGLIGPFPAVPGLGIG